MGVMKQELERIRHMIEPTVNAPSVYSAHRGRMVEMRGEISNEDVKLACDGLKQDMSYCGIEASDYDIVHDTFGDDLSNLKKLV
jgi:hypothetical protein